jgi:hypothetical protein
MKALRASNLYGKKVLFQDREYYFDVGYYGGGAPSIELVDESEGYPEVYARVTVNIPETKLEDDEVLIKSWSENEPIAEELRNSKFFRDTGKRIPTGYCEAEIWKVN